MSRLFIALTLCATTVAASDITVDLPGGSSMDFVWIEPGTFLMGSPESEEGRLPHEGPLHEVRITRGFYLGKFEVTQGQWESVMETSPWAVYPNQERNPSRPANYISWNMTHWFMHELNEAAGDSLYRLPTEAEWEYAARAGTTTKWSFGDDVGMLGDYAWYAHNSSDLGIPIGLPVGGKRPNPWGLHDMHGNVKEWVQDWYDAEYYSRSEATDPRGPDSGKFRVLKDGYSSYQPEGIRSAVRDGHGPVTFRPAIGFRVLRMAPIATASPQHTWGRIKHEAR